MKFAPVASLIVATSCLLLSTGCTSPKANSKGTKLSKPTVVDAACGQCLFGLKSEKKGCDLAVRLGGQSYFVDRYNMKQLGDAHADDGMCKVVRKAKVTGHVENGRFVASSFELLPSAK